MGNGRSSRNIIESSWDAIFLAAHVIFSFANTVYENAIGFDILSSNPWNHPNFASSSNPTGHAVQLPTDPVATLFAAGEAVSAAPVQSGLPAPIIEPGHLHTFNQGLSENGKALTLRRLTPEQLIALSNAIAGGYFSQASYLNLSHTDFSSGGMQHLAAALPSLPMLLHLDLGNNNLGWFGKHLNLFRNNFGHVRIRHLAQALLNLPAPIIEPEHLHAFNQGLSEDGTDLTLSNLTAEQVIALSNAIAGGYFSQVSHLNLSNTDFSSGSMEHLAAALPNLPNLLHLGLGNNDLDGFHMQRLAAALRHLPNLLHLSLGNNDLGWFGMKRLAAVLPSLSNLQHLNLASNNLGPNAVPHLATALQSLPKLQHLNLFGNNFGHEGIQDLARALLNYSTLGSLILRSLSQQLFATKPELILYENSISSDDNAILQKTCKQIGWNFFNYYWAHQHQH
jgi:Ran GTPase-activating protein (RanGAP) involved in mRNA processing and transport